MTAPQQHHRALIVALLALSLFVGVASPVLAQAPYLVQDINTSVPDSINSSFPSRFFNFDGRALFLVKDAGRDQLWISDLSEGGTAPVSSQLWLQNPPLAFLGQVNSIVLFAAAADSSTGMELWRTDGTEDGTFLLKDIHGGASHSYPTMGATLDGVYYFPAEDAFGRELWRTDGTVAGTYRVKDIALGIESSFPLYPIAFNGSIYFGARGGLWKSDGTGDGTVEVVPGVVAVPKAVIGSTLFFYGADPIAGRELWATDGTSAWRVRDINPGASGSLSIQHPAFNLGGQLLFFANDGVNGTELWKSDGTEAGTLLVRDINVGAASSFTGGLPLAKLGETLYFPANDGSSGSELWKTDGTTAGTSLVRDINVGAADGSPLFLAEAGGKLFFSAIDSASGRELWVSDGSESGTRIVEDIYPGFSESLVNGGGVTAIGNRVIFGALAPGIGVEPWASDGTPEGTSIIRNIAAEGGGSSHPTGMTAVGEALFFSANDAINGAELWRSDSSSTFMVPELVPGSTGTSPTKLNKCGQFLCFESQWQLWRTDGTAAGTSNILQHLGQTFEAAGVTFLTSRPQLYHIERLHEDGARELLATPWNLESVLATPHAFYFTDLVALRKSDGTAAGTQTVRRFSSQPILMGESNGIVYFQLARYDSFELWRTNGTYESTSFVKNIEGSDYYLSRTGTDVNGSFFFSVLASNGLTLWKTDGTSEGTLPVRTGFRSINGETGTTPQNLHGRLLFVADDNESGEELWISDGTTAGTKMIRDINPGLSGSTPRSLVIADGVAYFGATEPATGSELWRSDGTPEGTQPVYDLHLGHGSSYPHGLTPHNNKLYFSAHTLETGTELWAYPLPDDVSVSGSDSVVDESTGTASFRVSLSRPASTTVTVRARLTDGTANAPSDYTPVDEVISFQPGMTEIDVAFNVVADSLPEPDETVVVKLSEATNGRISDGHSVILIRDDDRAADLEIRAQRGQVVVFNHGPSAATDVMIELDSSDPYRWFTTCGPTPGPCMLGDVPVGTAKAAWMQSSAPSTVYTTTVSSPLSDPDLSNNTASAIGSGLFSIECDHISTSGTRVSIVVEGRTTDEEIFLSAVPSSSVSMPASVVVPAGTGAVEFLVQGLVEGQVTISATGRFSFFQTSPSTESLSTTVSSAACPLQPKACSPPTLTSRPPSSLRTLSGLPRIFSITATGTPDLKYEWSGAGEETESPQNRALTLRHPQIVNMFARVTNACGFAATGQITVTPFLRRPADFRDAGVSQPVVYRDGAWLNYSAPAGGVWTGQTSPNCIPAPADYNGDGVAEMAMLCNGAWHFYNPNGTYLKGIWTGGVPGDLPVPADYDGDGDDDVVIYRNGAWRFHDYATGSFIRGVWTGPGPNGIPVPGDYDNDGKADFSVYSFGPWHFYKPDGSYLKGIWTGGLSGDIPVPGDYTIDGKDEVVIYRGGAWLFYDFVTRAYVRGVWTGVAPVGGLPLQPAPLDTDGDGTVEFSVHSGPAWHFFNDNGSYWRGVWTGGGAGDQPLSRRQHINP